MYKDFYQHFNPELPNYGWKFLRNSANISHQPNSDDCGVYVIWFIECSIHGKDVRSITPEDAKARRLLWLIMFSPKEMFENQGLEPLPILKPSLPWWHAKSIKYRKKPRKISKKIFHAKICMA